MKGLRTPRLSLEGGRSKGPTTHHEPRAKSDATPLVRSAQGRRKVKAARGSTPPLGQSPEGPELQANGQDCPHSSPAFSVLGREDDERDPDRQGGTPVDGRLLPVTHPVSSGS